MPAYLFVSTAVTDLITLPDGISQPPLLGGAGLYALVGAKVWSDDVLLITGIGHDFLAEHGPWFYQNHLSTAGLSVVCEHTPRNAIHYFVDGEREEIPVFGPQHYGLIVPKAADVGRHCMAARGVYVFRGLDPDFWREMSSLRAQYGFRLMWELSAEAAVPAQLDAIRQTLRDVDLFSLNRTEALSLFATEHLDRAIAELQALKLPLVYLRLGAAGACMIAGDHVYRVPALANSCVVDPTGAGNSASGAVLVSFCEGKDPQVMGLIGAISASNVIAQYGPTPVLDKSLRHDAITRLDQALSGQMELEL